MGDRAEWLSTFLYQSISDVQGTIRQLDLKANAVLVFLTLLLTVTNHIGSAIDSALNSNHRWLGYCFAVAIPVLWFFAISCCYTALNAVFNPAGKIDNRGGQTRGVFFGAREFKFNTLSVLLGKASPRARPSLEAFIEKLPVGETAIHRELAFEQLKLFYIRDVKAIRLRFALGSAFLCLLLSVVVWLLAAPWTAGVGTYDA
jgi:hypothetical protein